MLPVFVMAQSGVRVRGLVRDSITHEPVSFAAVRLAADGWEGAPALTDDSGIFETYAMRPFEVIRVEASGYAPAVKRAPRSGTITVIELVPEGQQLGEVVAAGRSTKYSKKDNPAVELARLLRRNGARGDPERLPSFSYDVYERISLGLNDFHADESTALVSRFPFITDHIDTSYVTHKPVLTLASREKIAQRYHRLSPHSDKERVTALRSGGIDEIADAESMRRFYEDVLREVDIYDDDITLMQTRFVSPLSRVAPDFYRFYLTDTLTVGGDSCIVLSFAPRTKQTLGFTGSLYVVKSDTADAFVRKVDMRVPRAANLNYITFLRILQSYRRAPDGTRLKVSDEMAMEGRIAPGTPEVYAERRTIHAAHSALAPADSASLFSCPERQLILPLASERDSAWWEARRRELTDEGASSDASDLMARLRQNKWFFWGEKVLGVIVNGYIPTAMKAQDSKIDIGPINSFISYNELEGTRLNLALSTTTALSPRIFGRLYGGYGTRDHRWVYGGALEYSFRDKKKHPAEFPIHSLALEYEEDIERPGRRFLYTNPANVFLSLTRHPDRVLCYRRNARVRYTLELPSNFSLTALLAADRLEESPFIKFTDGYGNSFSHYTESSLQLKLRYAPGEKFYQGRTHRYPINLDAPVVTLSHTFAPCGFAGNRYALNLTEASVGKRFWFSAWGYLDALVRGGHAWCETPFPQLLIPNANPTYIIQPETFALMQPMEFANDSYISWHLTYWLNGAILNYIPGINRLKLREAVAFRGVWGHLSDKCNPEVNRRLLQFPLVAATRLMSGTPYMEIAAGLDNILTCLRVDYVWRLTYRDTPGCSRSGLQLALHFTF